MGSPGTTDVINGNRSRSAIVRFVSASYINLALIFIFIICLLINGDTTPLTKRGFFCNDSSINYPFKPDTIGIKTLFFFGLILPAIVIKVCDKSLEKKLSTSVRSSRQELGLFKKVRKISGSVLEVDAEDEELISDTPNVKRRACINSDGDCLEINDDTDSSLSAFERISNSEQFPSDEIDNDEDEEINLFTRIPLVDSEQEKSDKRRKTNFLIYHDYQRPFGEFQLFFFGLCTTMIFTGLGKITCGRFRPHFLQRCQPDVDCTKLENTSKYIEDFKCTNTALRPRDIPYMMTSWPSGHASMIFYSMTYMIIYLDTVIPLLIRLSPKDVRRRFDLLALYAIYVVMMSIAGYIAMTRISDYHHHATDVFSGSVIGTFIAICLAKSLSGRFSSVPAYSN